jgi:uncharacterized paraquat-inducible protein A
MVKCNKCQADNRDERKFCGECGADGWVERTEKTLATLS